MKAKGSPKSGGRKKGSPNKVTATTKTWIQNIIDSNRENLEADLLKMKPSERWAIAEKLLSYVVPKQRENTNTIEFSKFDESEIDQFIQNLKSKL